MILPDIANSGGNLGDWIERALPNVIYYSGCGIYGSCVTASDSRGKNTEGEVEVENS